MNRLVKKLNDELNCKVKYSEEHKKKILKKTKEIKNRKNWKRKFFSLGHIIILIYIIISTIILVNLLKSNTLLFVYLTGYGIILGLVEIAPYISLLTILLICNLIYKFILYRYHLHKYKKLESKKSDTAIVIANFDKFNLRDWLVPTFDINLKYICELVKLRRWKFKIFTNLTEDKLDEIIYNNEYKRLYLIGHGSRDAFSLYRDKPILYAKYTKENLNKELLKKFNQKEIKKEFIAQYHCNHHYGLSLADFIVDEKNRDNCDITWGTWNVFKLNNHIKKLLKEERRNVLKNESN